MSNPLNPNHYKAVGGSIEAIDVIEQFDLNYRLGNVVKYLLRAGKKDDRDQDLRKALAYLTREVTGRWPEDVRELPRQHDIFDGPLPPLDRHVYINRKK